MVLNDKVYKILKWVLLIVVPALITLISGLGSVLGFDTTALVAIIGLVAAFAGSCVGISATNYKIENLREFMAQSVQIILEMYHDADPEGKTEILEQIEKLKQL